MAKFKVGDKVKFKNLFKPERGEETGVVTGYDTDGSVLIRDDDGIKVKASEKLVRLANSVLSINSSAGDRGRKALSEGWGHGRLVTWEKEVEEGKRGAEKIRKDIRDLESTLPQVKGTEWFERTKDAIVFIKEFVAKHGIRINSVRSTNAVVAKAMAMNAVRRKPIKKGRYSGESGDMTYYVDYTADKWFAKKYGKDGTNVTEIKIMGPYEKDSKGRDVKHILYLFALGHESIKAKDQQTRSLVEAIMHGPNVVKQGDESFAWNSQEAESVDGVSRNTSDPYLGEKLKLMLAHEAVGVSKGGKPSVGDVVFEYRGKKYYVGKDSAHMVKQFADAGLVTMVNSSGKVSANSVVAKALNAVRNAWADAPDAATAKRDIEQTVRKAAEIAKRRYGAPKATYKMTPNDSLWCGYIDLTFNTEEEAKKCNPYYLFDELGDNKSILPKWSWAIGGFNYQKTGKVVRIFIGTLNT